MPKDFDDLATGKTERLPWHRPAPEPLSDSREGAVIPGVRNAEARQVYDIRVARLREALTRGDEAVLGTEIDEARRMMLWRARNVTDFRAFAESVIGASPELTDKWVAAAEADERPALPAHTLALLIRVESALLTSLPTARTELTEGANGMRLRLEVAVDDVPRAIDALSEAARAAEALRRFLRSEDDRPQRTDRAGEEGDAQGAGTERAARDEGGWEQDRGERWGGPAERNPGRDHDAGRNGGGRDDRAQQPRSGGPRDERGRTQAGGRDQQDRSGPRGSFQDRRGPRDQRDRNGPRDDRPRPFQDRGGPRDDRSRSFQDRGGARDDRPRPFQDRGGARDDRPRPFQDRSGARDDRPRPFQDRNGARDDRPRPFPDRNGARDDRPRPFQDRNGARDDRPRPFQDRSGARDDRPRPFPDRSGARDDRPRPYRDASGPNKQGGRQQQSNVVRDDRKGPNRGGGPRKAAPFPKRGGPKRFVKRGR